MPIPTALNRSSSCYSCCVPANNPQHTTYTQQTITIQPWHRQSGIITLTSMHASLASSTNKAQCTQQQPVNGLTDTQEAELLITSSETCDADSPLRATRAVLLQSSSHNPLATLAATNMALLSSDRILSWLDLINSICTLSTSDTPGMSPGCCLHPAVD